MHVNWITPLENLLPLIFLSRAGWHCTAAQGVLSPAPWQVEGAESWSGCQGRVPPCPLPSPCAPCALLPELALPHSSWPSSAILEQHIPSSCTAPLFSHPLFKEYPAVFMPPHLSSLLFRSESLTAFPFPFSPSSPWVFWKWLRKTVISQFMWHSLR